MKINLDDEAREIRARTYERKTSINAPQLLFIIVLGVFLANMLSWGTQRGIDLVIAKELMRQASNELAKVTAKNKAKLEEQKRINAKRAEEQRRINEQNQLEEMKRKAGYRKAMETCTFWQNQYRKEPTSYNKLQRRESCDLVNKFR